MNDELIIADLLLTAGVEFNQAVMSEQRRILPGSRDCSVKQRIHRATPVDADGALQQKSDGFKVGLSCMSVLLGFLRRQEDDGHTRQFIITSQSLQRLVHVRLVFFKL